MTWIMVDIEADGPCPGVYSMVQIGAVVVESLNNHKKDLYIDSYRGYLSPLPMAKCQKAALDSCNLTVEETWTYPSPKATMQDFHIWIQQMVKIYGKRAKFISDNNGFDWQFINYYFHRFCDGNPFGHSSTNLGSLYKGYVKDNKKNFKHLRKTVHDHNPVNDCLGNCEALITLIDEGIGFKL